jgi:hypothetical protein
MDSRNNKGGLLKGVDLGSQEKKERGEEIKEKSSTK